MKKSRGVCTSIKEVMDSVASTPEAQSTPNCGPDKNGVLKHDQDNIHCDRLPNYSPHTIETARSSQANQSSCSSAVIYKMMAHGSRGDRSPTRIEFNRVERKRNQTPGYIWFQKHERRYKFATTSSSKQKPAKVKDEYVTDKTKQQNSISNGHAIQTNANKKETPERVELYYFDHGNSSYYYTTDSPPQLYSDRLAHQTNDAATKFWAEFYGSIHIVVAIVISFVLQTYRFAMYSIVRPVIVGFLQITADYVIKPLLAVVFNGLLQPPLILGLNFFNSVADMLEPLARTLGHFVRPIAELLQAIRLVEISHYHQIVRKCSEENKEEDGDRHQDAEIGDVVYNTV